MRLKGDGLETIPDWDCNLIGRFSFVSDTNRLEIPKI
jgi:hypothetical protein